MTFPAFPSLAGLGWPVIRTRMGKTLVQESVSGKETRLQLWAYAKYKWSVQFGVLRTAAAFQEFQQLFGFVNSIAGMAQPFSYQDADDNAVTAQGFGTGDGTTTTFQLVRSFGGFAEPITYVSSLTVYNNGTVVPNTGGAGGYTYNDNGTVTFGTAPILGQSLTWTGSYGWLCRLAADAADFSADMQGFYSMKKLEFQSIKL